MYGPGAAEGCRSTVILETQQQINGRPTAFLEPAAAFNAGGVTKPRIGLALAINGMLCIPRLFSRVSTLAEEDTSDGFKA